MATRHASVLLASVRLFCARPLHAAARRTHVHVCDGVQTASTAVRAARVACRAHGGTRSLSDAVGAVRPRVPCYHTALRRTPGNRCWHTPTRGVHTGGNVCAATRATRSGGDSGADGGSGVGGVGSSAAGAPLARVDRSGSGAPTATGTAATATPTTPPASGAGATHTKNGSKGTDYSDWSGNGAGCGGGSARGVWGHWRPDPVPSAPFHTADAAPDTRAGSGRGYLGNEAKVAAGLGRCAARRARTELSTAHDDIVVAALAHEQKRKRQGRAQVPGQPSCVFTCGVPGAGKTLSLHRLWGLEHVTILDLDMEMLRHPQYDENDPAKVYALPGAYEWADAQLENRFRDMLARRHDPSMVGKVLAMDGTGTKVKRRIARMAAARGAGFWVRLLYVQVTLETALRRNQLRQRVVPRDVMERYHTVLEQSVRLLFPHADEVVVLDNNEDDNLTAGERWGPKTAGRGWPATTPRLHGYHPSAL